MKNLRILIPILFMQLCLYSIASAGYYDQNSLDRVAVQSARFVHTFNEGNSHGLGTLYTRNGILKLPGASAVSGRQNVTNAWQAGFDSGLESLVLFNVGLKQISRTKVLENGTYELTIRTSGGPIVQVGTFSVLWRVPRNFRHTPKIIFDTIDAN